MSSPVPNPPTTRHPSFPLCHSSDSNPVPIHLLLSFLQVHLDSRDPLFNRLPDILDVLSVFQQLSDALIREADRAYQAHKAILFRLQAENPDEDLKEALKYSVRKGALGHVAGTVVRRVRDRWGQGEEAGDKLWAFSLEARARHLGALISDPSCSLPDIAQAVDMYFPEDLTADTLNLYDLPLYIHATKAEDLPYLGTYRRRCLNWLDTAHSSSKRPSLKRLFGSADGGLAAITRNILIEAQRVVSDMEDLQAVLSHKDSRESNIKSEEKYHELQTRFDSNSPRRQPPVQNRPTPVLVDANAQAEAVALVDATTAQSSTRRVSFNDHSNVIPHFEPWDSRLEGDTHDLSTFDEAEHEEDRFVTSHRAESTSHIISSMPIKRESFVDAFSGSGMEKGSKREILADGDSLGNSQTQSQSQSLGDSQNDRKHQQQQHMMQPQKRYRSSLDTRPEVGDGAALHKKQKRSSLIEGSGCSAWTMKGSDVLGCS